jgi:imidazole glycerol phosphate synthase subunit HisF
MAEDTTTSVESVVGYKDGESLGNGEIVVYDFDKDGQFTGWHKASAEGQGQ